MTQRPQAVHPQEVERDAHHGSDTPGASILAVATPERTNGHDGAADPSLTNTSAQPLPNPSLSRAPSDSIRLAGDPSPSPVSLRPSEQLVQFRANTIAPSPPLVHSPPRPRSPSSEFVPPGPRATDAVNDGSVSASTRTTRDLESFRGGPPHTLRLQTDLQNIAPSAAGAQLRHRSGPAHPTATVALAAPTSTPPSNHIRPSTLVLQHQGSSSSLRPVSRTPSLKATGHHGFGTASAASSTVASPIIAAMGDVTPLPSPLLSGDSPGPWEKLGRSPPREVPFSLVPGAPEAAFVAGHAESPTAATAHQAKRKKAFADLLGGGSGGRPQAETNGEAQASLQQPHTRHRSLSEYVPDPMQLPKRMVTVSATHAAPSNGPDPVEAPYEAHMRREPHLSAVRGLTPMEKPPTPPPSESSLPYGDGATSSEQMLLSNKKRCDELFEARGRDDRKLRRWRAIRLLGQGTFSRVMLATSQVTSPGDATEPKQYDRRTLVAVKICEHGPKGGASEDRVEMSLKRELEIMRCIHHPSLVRLKAWNIEPSRAILVLSYCPGGDLFDVASAHRDLLTAPLLARMFAELVAAVRYLHQKHIVHRDIKLENVLVNLTSSALADPSINWATYPYSVTTLTDLGLSRHVAKDERLETRCGSDDYAAPEVIMGQPYDGHATDAWSLGVLLYALLEGRLPFDPHPGMSDAHRMRSRTSHRIARVEWRWIEFAGDDGDHEGDRAKFRAQGLMGAMEITEGLLKRARSRWTLDKVADVPWVREAISVEGGLRFWEEEEGEEVS
ncbi:serine/threonine-protein kinase-like protein [Niveomyces insectorum RCEF 264]|uniref:Serine/threonine-protein kinase-like protein n=1 Tax=Niveomyces insectorum RCEF 264 TaxID=1081102 RepID=A0A167MT73_9HYPO|nr:serine/threonine-protein kinase-like protein [Niveomyces insectorum RCEF 264]